MDISSIVTFLIVPLVIVILIAFNALYVAGEFATVAARKTRVTQMAANGHKGAKRLLPTITNGKKLDSYVATCQVGITISSLLVAAYSQAQLSPVVERILGNYGVNVATSTAISLIGVLALITTLQVILGELVPKSIGVQFPEKTAAFLFIPVNITGYLLFPLTWFFNTCGKFLLRITGLDDHGGHGHIYSPEEIEILVSESAEGGVLDRDERQMLRNTFRLQELTAGQVMVHRSKIVSASKNSSVREVLDLALEKGNTRILLHEGENTDRLTHFVHVKDLYKQHCEGKNDIHTIKRELMQVPESLDVTELWDLMRGKNQYLAVLFDEHGTTEGMVTLEDLIEEIFGEIQDEYDDERVLVMEMENGRLGFRSDLLVSDLNEYLEIDLPEDRAHTISGLVFTEYGDVPPVGKEILIGQVPVKVERVEDREIMRVSIARKYFENEEGKIVIDIPEWQLNVKGGGNND